MKTMFKILVILLVGVVVGGLFYGVVSMSSSGTGQPSGTELRASGQFPAAGEFSLPERSGEAGGTQFPSDSIKNLGIISLVSVIYLNTPKWSGRKKSILRVTS